MKKYFEFKQYLRYEGTLRGTVEWLSEYISSAEIVLNKDSHGYPQLVIKKEEEEELFLCGVKPYSHTQDSYICYDKNLSIYRVTAKRFDSVKEYFAIWLTPAAERLVEKMLIDCCEALKDYLNTDADTLEIKLI